EPEKLADDPDAGRQADHVGHRRELDKVHDMSADLRAAAQVARLEPVVLVRRVAGTEEDGVAAQRERGTVDGGDKVFQALDRGGTFVDRGIGMEQLAQRGLGVDEDRARDGQKGALEAGEPVTQAVRVGRGHDAVASASSKDSDAFTSLAGSRPILRTFAHAARYSRRATLHTVRRKAAARSAESRESSAARWARACS